MAKPTVELIVIGGSAGAFEVLCQLLDGLRPPRRAALAVVLHRAPDSGSALAELLATHTPLPVREVEDKDRIEPGRLYLAPPDYHVLIERNRSFALSVDEKVHHARPSIDVCFQSAAAGYGSRLIGILLSGANEDGAAGLAAIRQAGGLAIVQHPRTAEIDTMPRAAIAACDPDFLFTVETMCNLLSNLEDGNDDE